MYLPVRLLFVAALQVWQLDGQRLLSCRCNTQRQNAVGRAESFPRLVVASTIHRRRKTCRDTVSSSAGLACRDGSPLERSSRTTKEEEVSPATAQRRNERPFGNPRSFVAS